MSKRAASLALMVGIAGVAVVAWLLWPDAQPRPSVEPPPQAPAERRAPPRRPLAIGSSPVPAPDASVDTAPPPPVPDTPAEQALDAAFPGQRWVRCDVGAAAAEAGADDGRILRFLPPFEGAPRAVGVQVEDGELTAAVDSVGGEGLLQAGLSSIARLRWSGARDDDGWGSCTLAPVDTVALGGVVRWSDGRPAAGQQVRACEPDDLVLTDESGRFEAEVPAGRRCRALAVLTGPDRFGVGPAVIVDVQEDPVLDLELWLPAESETWDREGLLAHLDELSANMEAAHEAVAVLPTVFDRALEDPDLSADARARIEHMAEAAQAQDRVLLDRLHDARDQADPAADPSLWLSAW